MYVCVHPYVFHQQNQTNLREQKTIVILSNQNTGQLNKNKSKELFQNCDKRLLQHCMQQVYYKLHKQIGFILNCVALVVFGTPPDWWNQTTGKCSHQTNNTQTTKTEFDEKKTCPLADEPMPQTDRFVCNKIVFQATKAGGV